MIEKIYSEMEFMSKEKFRERKVIFGEGVLNAQIMLVGEAPGGEEEKQGRPFVGAAGKNLNEFLNAIELERADIYITNVVKLRPFKLSPKTGKPINRPPDKAELDFFIPYLLKEIKAIAPKIVVTLGNTALKAVTGNSKISIGDVHAKLIEKDGYSLFPLYHPASVIYNRSLKDTYYEDLLKLKDVLSNFEN